MSFKFENLIPDSVKDRFLEDESAPPQVSAKPIPAVAVPPSNFQNSLTSPITMQGQQGTSAMSGLFGSVGAQPAYTTPSATLAFLTDLRTKTDFDTTPLGQQLKSFMDGLADTGMADDLKSKTALKLSHQTPSQVVSVLQGLQAVLAADKQQFEATMQTATVAEVDARKTKSAQLQSAIEDAESRLNAQRQEKAGVDADLEQKRDRIASARANYAAASEARNTELADMISHYQSIPEVK